MLDGVPLDIRTINVTVDRPGFTFNPTSCNPLSITGLVASAQGAVAVVSSRFQVADCASLPFKPAFKVSTSAKTSRSNGASLDVKLSFPHPGPQPSGHSGEANIARVHVELPKALPSRLSTLQKACTDKTFEANPASCPPASRVGYARAITPVLPVPVEGPAFFVSHGGQKFPELVIVLQGYGITVDLQGETFISKAGVTSSTFKSVPDVPVSKFELTLPQGPDSALAANGNLCKIKGGLKMPTEFVAQNGAEIRQTTKITVNGCTKKKAKKASKSRKRHGKGGKKK